MLSFSQPSWKYLSWVLFLFLIGQVPALYMLTITLLHKHCINVNALLEECDNTDNTDNTQCKAKWCHIAQGVRFWYMTCKTWWCLLSIFHRLLLIFKCCLTLKELKGFVCSQYMKNVGAWTFLCKCFSVLNFVLI